MATGEMDSTEADALPGYEQEMRDTVTQYQVPPCWQICALTPLVAQSKLDKAEKTTNLYAKKISFLEDRGGRRRGKRPRTSNF